MKLRIKNLWSLIILPDKLPDADPDIVPNVSPPPDLPASQTLPGICIICFVPVLTNSTLILKMIGGMVIPKRRHF